MIASEVEVPGTAAAASATLDGKVGVSQALGQLWLKYEAANRYRIACLERAAVAWMAGSLPADGRRAAEREAHKLTGALGSFGFVEGSRLARDAETLLQSPASDPRKLEAIVVGLRRELDRNPHRVEVSETPAAHQPVLLIVDHDTAFAEHLVLEARAHNFLATRVASIAAARDAFAVSPPDAVLLELSFEGSEDEALELLADLNGQLRDMPVLVLTARTSLLDRVNVARLGASAYLQKPVPPAQVMDAAAHLLSRDRVVEKRILAVDDDPQVLETLQAVLGPREYRLLSVSDPLRFWEALEESPPDLLLLDVDMPGLSGIDLCQAVRTDLRWAGLPILFLTGMSDPTIIQRVFAAGADDYVPKPIVPAELLTRVGNRLERTQLHRRLAEVDVLTGLANRHKATQALGRLLRLSERHGQPVSLAVVDLDHFKRINDEYGHTVGDAVLRRTGELLYRAFRRDDVVGRWGGEEFVVGLYGMPLTAGIERLRQALEILRGEEFRAPDGRAFRVSFSAG
ncbi:MAG: response regulator, partial [Chloroflexota bacterium]|nr:response regulator [Chloroflexota bacterium]